MWWSRLDLNQRPRDYESPALTTELRDQGTGDNVARVVVFATIARVFSAIMESGEFMGCARLRHIRHSSSAIQPTASSIFHV